MSRKQNQKSYLEDLIFDSDLDFANKAETDLLIREEAKQLAQEYMTKEKLVVSEIADKSFVSKIEKLEEDSARNMEAIKKNNDSWKESKDILSRIEARLVDFDNELKNLKGNNSNTVKEVAKVSSTPIDNKNADIIDSIKNTLIENNESLKEAFGNMVNQLSDVLSKTNPTYTTIDEPETNLTLEQLILDEEEKNPNNSVELQNETFEFELTPLFEQEIEEKNIEEEKNDVETIEEISIPSKVEFNNENEIIQKEVEKIVENTKIEPINWEGFDDDEDDLSNKSTTNLELEELRDKHSKLLSDQEKLNKEIEIIKQSINDFILASEYSSKNILEQTIDNAHKLSLDVNVVKEQYSNLESEIDKIYSTWLENNQLLTNLENLLLDLNNKNDDLISDRYGYNQEIIDKTINNEKYINDLSIESQNIKSSIEQINERLTMVEDLTHTFNPEDFINKNLTESMVNEVTEISKGIVEQELSKRNLFDPKEIMTKERVIDEIMENDIFNYSLEKKIQQTISEAKLDRKYTDEEKLEIIDFTTNSDKFRSSISAEVNYVSNDIKLEFNDRFTKLRDEFYNTNMHNNNKFSVIEDKMNSKKEILQKSEIIEMVFASKELNDIINDKLVYVVNDKLDDLKESMSIIENKILGSVKRYLDEDIQDNLKKEIIESKDIRQKIKNESLNAIYSELTEHDKKYEDQKKEILENYQALLENNRILENLEKLILKQVEEIEGFKKDKETSFDIAIEKINAQKLEIDSLKEKVLEVYGKDLVINTSPEQVYDNEIFDKVRSLTASLVKDEIKKLNLVQQTTKNENGNEVVTPMFLVEDNENESEFFKNRINDILTRLDQGFEPLENINQKLPLTDEYKFNLKDLKIDLDNLKENKIEEEQDDDYGWFYEQEFKNHKEEKANRKTNDEWLNEELNKQIGNKE